MKPPVELLEALEKVDTAAIDFETRPKEGYPDNKDVKTNPRTCEIEWVSMAVGPRKAQCWDWPIQRGEDPLQDLRAWMDNPKHTLIAHNFKFESKMMQHECGGYRPKARPVCTQVAAWMLDEDRKRYALKNKQGTGLAQEILKMNMISYNEAFSARGGMFGNDVWKQYCRDDSTAAFRLWAKFEKKLEKEGMLKLFHEIEMPCTPIIAEMELRGVRLDETKLGGFLKEYEQKYDDLTAAIHEMAGHEFNITSTHQLGSVLFEEMGASTDGIKKGKSGHWPTNEETLKLLAERGVDFASKILEFRSVGTQIKMFFRPLLHQIKTTGGLIFPQAHQTGTRSGRWAYQNPNITQFTGGHKSPLRSTVIPHPGMVFVGGDFSQAELRVMAHRSQDATLIENYMQDMADLHARTAKILGVSRKLAKNCNFGLLYGMGAAGLQRYVKNKAGIEMTLQEATRIRDAFFSGYPGLRRYYKRVEAYVREHKIIRDICNRVRHLKEVYHEDESQAFRFAINVSIQASVGSIVKLAIRNIYRKAHELGIYGPDKFHLLFQVHDELIAECPPELVEQCRALMKHEMENAVKLRVPLVADIVSADNWMDMKG